MAKARSLVGVDVHANKVVAAVLDAETGELQCFGISGDVGEAAGLCAGLPRPVRAAYEAGPTGYGLARELQRRGVQCVVAAPSKIPRAPGDRVKTDRRDAELLVRLLLACKLHAVRVPDAGEEALRDLVRAREAVRVDLMRCRHRVSKLLLRHGIRFDDGRACNERHRAWLAQVQLGLPAAQTTLIDACGAVDALVHRRDQLERQIVAMLPASPWVSQVARLRCLRGMGNPRLSYEQPARAPGRRPILDSGTPRRTTVLRPPGSAHISLTARRAQQPPDRHQPSRPHQHQRERQRATTGCSA
ncbi:MAG: Mobile element protein [uncultured Solirubrobacteraceae bacterium]|uniref:Mobile element protein n=1 Tax=uncultured Solirubrobacteraceae bacterium TaxID=1162706 RepID=A0A6J4TMY0_9ACTN|nr:MAG: Mobile element protein [uncultured Solirubrobacteraceae bacterium]